MTSRGKSTVRGFETEIEKSREEANWKKVVDLAQQLKQRSPQHESLAHFLMGEGKLEAFLEEWPPVPDHAERAARELGEARALLALATDEAGRRAGVALDAHLLLAKLHYAQAAHADALKHFQLAELDTLTEKDLPVRSLRIVAESYAIKGLCVDAASGGAGGSRYKAAEREAEAVRAFSLAADLTLLYLQRTARPAGPVLDAALLRAPHMHARARRTTQAIDRYRDMLSAVECAATAPLRLTLARQLAELLLRAAPGPLYEPPRRPDRPERPERPSPWRPRKYAAPNQFVPASEWEEAVLVLGVGEALAVRDAVLSQSAEFRAARDLSLGNAVSVADLLATAAPRWGQRALVLESLERAMKFSYGSAHVWRQRALATAAAAAAAPPPPRAAPACLGGGAGGGAGGGESAAAVRAAGVMTRALPLSPQDAALRLVAADTAYRLGWLAEGIELAEAALALEEARDGPLRARAALAAGRGYHARAERTLDRVEREAWRARGAERLALAARLDPADHLALYALARQHTRAGALDAALAAVRGCLRARAECAPALRLAIALCSCAGAGPRSPRALHAARLARHHYPRAEWPLAALAALQLTWESGEAALATGKELLALLNSGAAEEEGGAGYAELAESEASESVAGRGGAGAGRALSDAASSAPGSAGAGAGPGAGAQARAAAWLALAELCLRLGRRHAAAGCVAEAAALAPAEPLVLYTRGLVLAAAADWDEARQCFQDALALQPTHVDTAVQLGSAYYALGWLRLAESTLREAAALEPRRADTWRRLALVLAALGEPAAAADCAAAALRLQPLAPHPALPL